MRERKKERKKISNNNRENTRYKCVKERKKERK